MNTKDITREIAEGKKLLAGSFFRVEEIETKDSCSLSRLVLKDRDGQILIVSMESYSMKVYEVVKQKPVEKWVVKYDFKSALAGEKVFDSKDQAEDFTQNLDDDWKFEIISTSVEPVVKLEPSTDDLPF